MLPQLLIRVSRTAKPQIDEESVPSELICMVGRRRTLERAAKGQRRVAEEKEKKAIIKDAGHNKTTIKFAERNKQH